MESKSLPPVTHDIAGLDLLVGMVPVAAGHTPQHAVLVASFLARNSKGKPVKE